MNQAPKFIIVDLFCGAGGTTLGFEMAKNGIAKVIACVNHDPKAIKSHWANHPEVVHFEEDILTLDLTELISLTNHYRKLYPEAKVILWASLECTNFSKAKGGQPRDADSRTLAWGLPRYVDALKPDYIQIENVVEFMSWGPLTAKVVKSEDGYPCCNFEYALQWEHAYENLDINTNRKPKNKDLLSGKWKPIWNAQPESRKNGIDWIKWREFICQEFGYRDEWKELNSADFGAYTSRNRLFGIFAKDILPIVFPKPTHAKVPAKNPLFGNLHKWMPVKEVLDFSDEGSSIFNRNTPLVDASLERIYAGLVRFVAGGKENFLIKYNSMNRSGGYQAPSTDEPCPTIACQNRLGVVNAAFLQKNFSGHPDSKVQSINNPAGTITTVDHHSLVQSSFLCKYHKTGENVLSVENPASTITTKDRIAKVECFLTKYNSGRPDNKIQSVEVPSATLTTSDRMCKVNCSFIETQYGSGQKVTSIDSPSGTLLNTPKQRLVNIVKNQNWNDKQYSGTLNHQSIEQPAGAILSNDKHCLMSCQPFIVNTNYANQGSSIDNPSPTIVSSRRHMYLLYPSHGGHTQSIENPCPVIVARQDKSPLYLMNAVEGSYQIPVYETDSEVMVKIKEFMALYGIVDIKMRMLKVPELLKIQGFPSDYKLVGNQSDQKKFIGNSVVPLVVKYWIEALANLNI
ncbi:DNA cytosine methyltransferase [Emticicia sp. BO119]|uniref:DNA cytosine methyltransferase n=1 Tax=Emticicia sp. BO119 TaxID=2757768 RepID=UPI0015F0012E|nr:DNA cytosine methyltransferase [Emticicia sp. BO119]MBA4852045.1 DNA cytosine methyltransferase [Emticicia sp. BO119]